MSAIAVFTSRSNSHPFQERHVSVHEPIKIGRSVARARPAPNNAIFDCKVLSRNHALLWYENGMFYLQDTKSSNGTFVNNQRLSKGSEESPPHEVFSGDIIQFGVDVMENSRRVTHSCIIASVQLYHADGREAINDHSSPFLNSSGAGLGAQSQELYQIAQYLQEALHREQMLENKLATLQRLVQQTQQASEGGWQALIDEDRLLSRLEVLENQLATYSKNQTEDTLRQELTHLQEDKYNYETTAKESLRKVLQEKVDAVRKLSDLERSLSNTEDECCHLRDMYETSQKELLALAEKHTEKQNELVALQEQIQEAEKKHTNEVEDADQQRAELQCRLDQMIEHETLLQVKVESLQANNDFTKEQLTNMKAKMEAQKENGSEGEGGPRICEQESQGVQVDLVNLLDLKHLQERESCESESSSDGDPDEEAKIKDILDCLDESIEGKVRDDLNDTDSMKDQENLNEEELKDKLKETQSKIEDYKRQFEQSSLKLRESHNQIEKLQGDLEAAKSEITTKAAKISSLEETLLLSESLVQQKLEKAVADLSLQLSEAKIRAENSMMLANKLKDQVSKLESDLEAYKTSEKTTSLPLATSAPDLDLHDNRTADANHTDSQLADVTEINKLKGMLEIIKQEKFKTEEEACKFKGDLESSQLQLTDCSVEVRSLQQQLEEAKKTAVEKLEQNVKLRDQLQELERSSKDVRQQILALKDKLVESELNRKQAKNEADQLKLQVQSLHEELEYEQSTKILTDDTTKELQAHASQTRREFLSLKEECGSLRKRIQDIEMEMGLSRRENHRLQNDYVKLQESYHELEQLKETIEDKHLAWRLNLTDAQKESHQSDARLSEAEDQITLLTKTNTSLNAELDQTFDDMSFMAYKSRTISACAIIPLLIILFAIVMAFNPILSRITATSSPS